MMSKKRQKTIKRKSANKAIFILLSVILILAALTTYALINRADIKEEVIENKDLLILKNFSEPSTIIMYLPAVDNNGSGYITTLKVEAMPGTGRTLVDINSLLFWEDTQQSIRKAKGIAEKISRVNTSNVDLIYTISANASLIGGESAGAALTIATIAVLENKKIGDDVIITGSVNHDGSIGPVQGVLSKAIAAKEFGAKLLLVPLLQSREVIYESQKHCDTINGFEICTTEQIPRKSNVSEEAKIDVREVGTISDALKYFIK